MDIDITQDDIRSWGGEMQKDGYHNIFQEMRRVLPKRENLEEEDITVKVKERCGGLEKWAGAVCPCEATGNMMFDEKNQFLYRKVGDEMFS